MARTNNQKTAAPLLPLHPTLNSLSEAAAGCRACDLWKKGTQTVFGEGARNAEVMFVGEQPGDKEDLAGKPFVGPAGKVLDKADGSRHRQIKGIRYKCGKAFQVGAARQEA